MLNMDPYVYPGTTLLKNLRDIRDPDEFEIFEALATSRRISELSLKSKSGNLDVSHLQSIHQYIFQDVYSWAGKFRSVDIARSNQFYFGFAAMLSAALEDLLGKLRNERYLADFDVTLFAKRATYYIGELNAIHPFRDGNGRAQREFIRQLAMRNGFKLNWSRVSRQQMYDASHSSFLSGDNSRFETVQNSAFDPF